MSFTVYVGTTTKRLNSTFQPSYSGWTSAEAVWKNAKDLDSPTISLYLPGLSDYPQWNYMYIPAVKSYYWITSIITPRADTWEVSGEMDVLATYRSAIMGTSCLIEYGFNTELADYNRRLTDNRQAVSMIPDTYTEHSDVGIPWDETEGVYIMTAVGASNGVTAWALTASQLVGVVAALNTDIATAIAEGATLEEILRFFTIHGLSQGSAMSAIRSCIWLPVENGLIPGTLSTIYLGDFSTGVTGKRISRNYLVSSSPIGIPWPVDDWRRNLCQVKIYLPFSGTVVLPTDKYNNVESVTIQWGIDLLTGNTSISVRSTVNDEGEFITYVGGGNCASTYAIGSSNVPIQNFASGVASVVGGSIQTGVGIASTVAGLGVGGSILGFAGASAGSALGAGIGVAGLGSGLGNMVSGAMQASTPMVQCAGSASGTANIVQPLDVYVTVVYYPPIDNENFQELYGRPVMRIGTPVAGYCKTRGFSLTGATAREAEQRLIAYFMDSGTFIE